MGLRAVKNIFRRYPDTTRPDAKILQFPEICLTTNDFQFDNKYYLQVEEMAMGQKVCTILRQHLYDSVEEGSTGTF